MPPPGRFTVSVPAVLVSVNQMIVIASGAGFCRYGLTVESSTRLSKTSTERTVERKQMVDIGLNRGPNLYHDASGFQDKAAENNVGYVD